MPDFIITGPIHFNVDHIATFAKPATQPQTVIVMAVAGSPPVAVRITPAEILAALKKAGREREFIELHSAVLSVGKIWIAPAHILAIVDQPNGSALTLANGGVPETVREKADEVRKLIDSAAGFRLNGIGMLNS